MAFRPLAALALVPLFAVTVASQSTAELARPKPRSVLSTQPLNIIFNAYNGEFERALNNTMTLGANVSYWSPNLDGSDENDDLGYLSADLKFRYYPSAQPFEGFAFGMSVGMSQVKEEDWSTGETIEVTAPSIGTYLDYSWLMGPTNRFFVGVGIGAKALLLKDDNRFSTTDVASRYPTARLSVGFGF